jgi:HEAT repeat protein
MTERYEPPSEFLKALIDDDAPLAVGEHAAANLLRLIEMTRDEHPANRDWATLLLAQQEIDTPEIREALLEAAEDENEYVRAEAILGLSQRDKALALPLLQRELSSESIAMPLFEAASIVAHPSLAADLRAFAQPSGDDFLDRLALEALEACGGAASS